MVCRRRFFFILTRIHALMISLLWNLGGLIKVWCIPKHQNWLFQQTILVFIHMNTETNVDLFKFSPFLSLNCKCWTVVLPFCWLLYLFVFFWLLQHKFPMQTWRFYRPRHTMLMCTKIKHNCLLILYFYPKFTIYAKLHHIFLVGQSEGTNFFCDNRILKCVCGKYGIK